MLATLMEMELENLIEKLAQLLLNNPHHKTDKLKHRFL